MSRNLFSSWAAGLADGEFAQALACVGLARQPQPSFEPADLDAMVKDGFDAETRLLSIHAKAIAWLAFPHRENKVFDKSIAPATQYVKLWQTLLARLRRGAGDLIRIEILPEFPEREPRQPLFALQWLAKELGRPEVGVSSVTVRREAPGLEVGWGWPMRIGVLAGQPSAALRKLLDGRPWPEMFELVLADRGERECDLLLLDADLRGALAQVLAVSRRMTADCTVVLGGAGVDDTRAARLAASLRTEARTSGIAIADVAPDARNVWLGDLLREITHNMPLDVALWRAASTARAPQPYFEATGSLLRFARLAQTAARMADHLRSVGAALPAAIMANAVLSGAFEHEEHDARAIADARRSAESSRGTLRFLKKNGAPAPQPQPQPQPQAEERRVNFDLYDQASPDAALKGKPLAPGRHYRLDLSIGYPRGDSGSADGAFPSHKLPPGGHELNVAWVPLTRDDRGALPGPQTAKIFLPALGESGKCSFGFDTVARSGRFDARVIVSFGNRVVQTLMFSAGVGRAPLPGLKIESVAATDLDQLAYRSRVDASIVVNESPAGVPGATALAGGEVTYAELPNMEALVAEIRKSLKQLTARKEPFTALDDQALRGQLFNLAKYGRMLWRELNPAIRSALADAAALQVIDARPGAYLPVEFFFDCALPAPKNEMCPKAREFLEDSNKPHKECPHHGDTDFLCPLRFWGFQRVIERQAVYATDKDAGKFRLKSPAPVRPRIDAFRSALFAASDKVADADQGEVLKALKKQNVKQIAQVKDWNAWRKVVKTNSPTLLVLLPHSDRALDENGKKTIEEALEVGGKLLALSDLAEEDLSGPESPEPVVFLLGCSTNLVELPFANFVSYARKLNASLVVGTLSPVSGHRAAQFVAQMLEGLAAGADRSFGEAFLKVRRSLLAKGDGFALALVAYGDVDWIV